MLKYRFAIMQYRLWATLLLATLLACCSRSGEDDGTTLVKRYIEGESLPDSITPVQVHLLLNKMTTSLLSSDWNSAFSLEKTPIEAKMLAKVDSAVVVSVLEHLALNCNEPLRLRTCAFYVLEERYYEKQPSEVLDVYLSQVNGFCYDPFVYFHSAYSLMRIYDRTEQPRILGDQWGKIVRHSLLLFAASSDVVDKYHMYLILRGIAARGHASWDEMTELAEEVGGETLKRELVYYRKINGSSGGKLAPNVLNYYKGNMREAQPQR